jgi:hypothetical protein
MHVQAGKVRCDPVKLYIKLYVKILRNVRSKARHVQPEDALSTRAKQRERGANGIAAKSANFRLETGFRCYPIKAAYPLSDTRLLPLQGKL